MKGQHLFVRVATAEDRAEIERFYSNEHEADHRDPLPSGGVPRDGLIGKLVGDLVAHLTFSRSEQDLRIESIHVARLLRRKRIGRFMILELERLARSLGDRRLIASSECDAAPFLEAVGFERSSSAPLLTKTIEERKTP